MIKIYWVPRYKENRESCLIGQGLANNPRVELVDNHEESDFIFHFFYRKYKDAEKNREIMQFYSQEYPRHKTVMIDYHDNPNWYCQVPCFAYFKRSWSFGINEGRYTVRQPIQHPLYMHPLTMAIMDEFISDPHHYKNSKRDVILSCTLRKKEKRGHIDRIRILRLLKHMKLQGNVQIGQFNKGNMKRFNAPDMRGYFDLLRRSRIVVTCNPSKWEGDHRTWEAFANGALVFVDRTLTPLVHPLIDGKHCIFYDLSDEGLEKLQKKIFFFLANPQWADDIAKAGHEFTMKYHRSSNRIDEILEVIT